MSRCLCGYKLGEGYFLGCRQCVAHNENKARSRRRPNRSGDVSDDDFEAPKTKKSCVIPQQTEAMVVKSTGASENPSGTLEHANAALEASGWRRCSSKEGPNIQHDDFDVVHIRRDGNCLFHCFAAIVMQLGLVQECTQGTMRKNIADYWRKNNGAIECDSTYGDGAETITVPYTCDHIDAIEKGVGGRNAYGEVPEIAAFCKMYDLTVIVFGPESNPPGSPPLIMNPLLGKPPHMLLQTLAWKDGGKRQPGRDHWQILKHKHQEPDVAQEPVDVGKPQSHAKGRDVHQLPAAASPAPKLTEVQRAERRAANQAAALAEKEAEAERQVAAARAFIASGGTFDFREPAETPLSSVAVPSVVSQVPTLADLQQKVQDLKRAEAAAMRAADLTATERIALDDDGKAADDSDDASDAASHRTDAVDHPDGEVMAGREKRKVTHWVHRTRITCLRLIQRMNPFAAKDSGLMWQQIAEQMHRDTADVVETNARGKSVSCQVHSNGVALMMWYNRQLQMMESSYSEGKEKSTSGQTGQFKSAIQTKARQSGDNEAEIELEWTVLLNLKALQKDANQAATLKKLSAGRAKDYKDKIIPDAVLEMACSSKKVETEAIAELERRMKMYAQQEQTLTGANRLPMMSQQQIQERDLLAQLKQQKAGKKDRKDGEPSVEEDTEPSSDKGRGKNNLKRSFDMMTEQMTGLAKFLKEETVQPTTLQDLQSLLAGIDKDVSDGLKLEADERAQLRAMFLRQYAKSRIQAVHHTGGDK